MSICASVTVKHLRFGEGMMKTLLELILAIFAILPVMPMKATVFHYSLLMCPCDNHVMCLFAEHVCIALGVSVQEFSAQQTRGGIHTLVHLLY